jgi:ubiquinone/menaquinone biosynthesis C-methylase UbiE
VRQANTTIKSKNMPYIADMSIEKYIDHVQEHHPFLYDAIDVEKLRSSGIRHYIDEMNSKSWEFEDLSQGGRGDSYNKSQISADKRLTGTKSLLKLFSDTSESLPSEDKLILDALAGNGTITRLVQQKQWKTARIISADLSQLMARECIRQGFPCIRQSATRSLLRDESLDGVLIAYGSHHLAGDERDAAVGEAFRTLRKGGRLVLHDFETGTPAADWFDRVVHPFSRTGHLHLHFSREEMFTRMTAGGFREVRILDVHDPFRERGRTEKEAEDAVLMHLYHMYDLVRIAGDGPVLDRMKRAVEEVFGGIGISRGGETCIATVDRTALVAVGVKG